MTDSSLIPAPSAAARVFIGPEPLPWLRAAVLAGGGVESPLDDADAAVWFGFPHNFPPLPDNIAWVQLPFAGIEPWVESGLLDARREWTNGAGVYADTVAEHALALLLTGVRGLRRAIATSTWDPAGVGPAVGTLRGATVGVIGAGGIGRALIPMLRSLGAAVIAVNRSGRAVEVEGPSPRESAAVETVPVADLDAVLRRCDHVVLAAPGTDKTRELVGGAQLALLRPHSWVVNVGRGPLIDTAALAAALEEGRIGGAALDVTEPEPLPDGHPLWSLPNAIITPHVANPPQGIADLLAARITENVRRFASGRELLGVIDPARGY